MMMIRCVMPLIDVCSISRIEGALTVVGGKLAIKGKLPELTKVQCDADKITRIELTD